MTMWFTHINIGTKQGLGFGLVLVFLAAINFQSLQNLGVLKDDLDEVSGNWLPRVIAISELNLNTSELRRLQLSHAYAQQAELRQAHADSMIQLIDRINENRDTYEDFRSDSEARGLYSEDEQARYQVFDEGWADYQDLATEVYAFTVGGQSEAAINLLDGEARVTYDRLSASLEDLVSVTQARARDSAREAEQTYLRTRAISITLLITSVLLSALITMWLVRHITSRVSDLQVAARRVARGDLNVRTEVKYRDEIGWLARSFNQMTTSLKEYRDKTEQQAAELLSKQETLRQTNLNLAEQSRSLERQKIEIVRKNVDLQGALEKLRTTQEQLIMSEKMASLGDLVAGVAHEINNPINFVSSNVQPLRRDIEDLMVLLSEYESLIRDAASNGLSDEMEMLKRRFDYDVVVEEINQLLSGIQEGAERTAAIVRGLRNFSRMDEDQLHPFDVNDGLESTLLILHNEIKRRIEIVKDLDEIPSIMGYPGKLNQVFMNILSNAIQAIEDRGKIFISTRCEDSEVVISIRDTGPGVPNEIANRIFEPFFTTKEVGRGTGLGLSISYGIIEDHGGHIEVGSKPNEGAEFRIYLPISK
jgi:signal transduction histidine kinase